MRPVIFARVAYMKKYRGVNGQDIPKNGGAYVKEMKDAHEAWNFDPIEIAGQAGRWCLGYCQPVGGCANPQLHLEKITGCEASGKETELNGVTVVFVAKTDVGLRIVGFYKNATVYRYMQRMEFDSGYVQDYQFAARKEDCVLLPPNARTGDCGWSVPMSTGRNNTFGMGRSNLWFAASTDADEEEKTYAEQMLKRIDEYRGGNWMEV